MATYVAVGVRTDCDTLIKRFAKLNTLRYHAFTEIWRDMKFSYIYYGHSTLEELLEFTEEALRIAKEMWLKAENLNEQAGGMYTLYGLYLKQPTDGYVKVRLTPQDYELVEKFHESVKMGCHHDANYILARMHALGAFRFCVSDYTYGIEKCIRRYHESDRSLKEVKEEPFYVKKLRNDEIFLKLDDAFKEYHKSKCKLVSGNSVKPPALLNYVNSDFAQKLKKSFQKITHLPDDPIHKDKETVEDQDTSKSKVCDKNVASSTTSQFKPPWWMLPVRNSVQDEVSSSDSEAESEGIGVHEISEKTCARTEQDKRDALIVSLGMSGDEGECEDEDTELLPEFKDPVASCSHDMPAIM